MNTELKRIYAKTAYRQTCESLLKKHTAVIDKAFDRIHKAIEEGKASVKFNARTFHESLTKEEIAELRFTQRYFESLGYSFDIDASGNGTIWDITIGWNKGE